MSTLTDPTALVGAWRLERVIEDRLTGTRSHVDGRLLLAVVSPGRLSWTETGRWRQPDVDVEVHRALWVEHAADGWWVRFEDGRDFHRWAPGEDVVHDCAPDTYRGVVTGSTAGWTVRWDVVGPQKDYDMQTVLTPEG